MRFENYPKKIVAINEAVRFPHVKQYFGGQSGGKWRGTGFYFDLLKENEAQIQKEFGGKVHFAIPKTSIIQTDCFAEFVERNRLWEILSSDKTDNEVAGLFLDAKFSPGQEAEFSKILAHHTRPLAVRSSSPVEDAERSSFAGIFYSVFIPNQNPSDSARLAQFEGALKLVYASAFSSAAREYKRRMGIVGGDGMAVMVQNVVGREWNSPSGSRLYYPEGSYAAFTFNDYAVAGIDPKDGFARVAFGLGPGVVGDADRTFVRVNLGKPYPLAGMYDVRQALNASPRNFFSLEISEDGSVPQSEEHFLRNRPIYSDGEKSLHNYHTQLYDHHGDRLGASEGAPFFTMPFIFNQNNTLLLPAFRYLNQLLKSNFGMEVDHEGAFDRMDGHLVVYPLQARPQVRSERQRVDALPEVAPEQRIFRTANAQGKGNYSFSYVVHIPLEQFNSRTSHEIGAELRAINHELRELGPNGYYALFVPGRFGSSDESLGVRGDFSTISNAMVIAERIVGTRGWEASQGTHMFEAVVGAGMALCDYDKEDGLAEKLSALATEVSPRKYATVYRFDPPISMQIDKEGGLLMYSGKQGTA